MQIKTLFRVVLLMSILGLLLLIVDFGFNQSHIVQTIINGYYFLLLLASTATAFIRYYVLKRKPPLKVALFDFISVAFTLAIIINQLIVEFSSVEGNFLHNNLWISIALIFTFIRESAERRLNYKRKMINPAQLFIISFLGIILMGAMLLLLPNATNNDISFLDALFTSTSAVCVTGLIVVDTATDFTEFGQVIIMLLIQIGGLGILTFTSYFSYFFKGGSSYENQLSLGEMTNSQKIGEVFSTLKRILIITFTIELIGALFIFSSLDASVFGSFFERVFFSAFHSVSAFCNAGFSTLSNGLYDESTRFNYWLQLSLIFLFVMGGLGFPIVLNILKYTKYFVLNKVLFFLKRERKHKPWVLSLNSRITLITTMTLFIVGTIIFYIFEYNNTLSEHSGFGKIVTALFGAATPRTAGFNTIDFGAVNFPTTMLIFLLMWIGASPASTGGGIKTNTFAIATLNFISLARGKTRIEIFRREIADISIRRAFAVIALSLVVIGIGIILISIFDSDKDSQSIAFECFSAYSTVGLSVGITADLSSYSKIVLMLIMLIGRVSMLTILIAVFRKVKHKNYRYPKEEITIN